MRGTLRLLGLHPTNNPGILVISITSNTRHLADASSTSFRGILPSHADVRCGVDLHSYQLPVRLRASRYHLSDEVTFEQKHYTAEIFS